MIKDLNKCKAEFNALLSGSRTDLEEETKNFLTRIKFFQHERMVHLIVTMTMSLLTVITACTLVMLHEFNLPVILLFVLFLSLTAAYLIHYYKLENGVQSLYIIYRKLQEKEQKSQNFCENVKK